MLRLIPILLLLSTFCMAQNEKDNDIQLLIDKSRNKEVNINSRKEAINRAYELTLSEGNDSLKSKLLQSISKTYLNLEDSINFRKTYKIGLLKAKQVKDSISIANHFWNLGFYYRKIDKKDSAYYFYNSSKKIFDKATPNHINVGKLLFNMARIQKDVKDYTGSELTTTSAIKIFEPLNDYRRLYNCYNNLGIVFNNLEEYEQAIDYHNKALKVLQKIPKKNINHVISLNNIGVVYTNKGNHIKAIEMYKQALAFDDSLFFTNPKQYAMSLDNLAYSKFKINDTIGILPQFTEALSIRENINHNSGIIANKLHLGEYYLAKDDSILSKKHSLDAVALAKNVKSYDHLLDLYKLLSKIEPKKDAYYLNQYIHLNDSLVKHERSIRNKFARIKFETDVVESENKKLNITNKWILVISSAIIFFSFLIYVITQQRTRNKELEMEQQQQRANEEIYNLMIDQQDKIEEGRKREKERISLELHDGILGRLFGTRLSLGSLNAKDDANSKRTREQYINELQSIEEEVRNISHELGLDNFDKTTSYSTMITNLLEEQSKITNFKYQIEDDDRIVWTDIPGHIKINIYRIIQESVQNINKYAKAQNVILDFKKNNNHIILTIKDDGIGFNQEKRSSGIGLKNMKSRVTLLHGQFTINSVPGKGTSISVDVPMT